MDCSMSADDRNHRPELGVVSTLLSLSSFSVYCVRDIVHNCTINYRHLN